MCMWVSGGPHLFCAPGQGGQQEAPTSLSVWVWVWVWVCTRTCVCMCACTHEGVCVRHWCAKHASRLSQLLFEKVNLVSSRKNGAGTDKSSPTHCWVHLVQEDTVCLKRSSYIWNAKSPLFIRLWKGIHIDEMNPPCHRHCDLQAGMHSSGRAFKGASIQAGLHVFSICCHRS